MPPSTEVMIQEEIFFVQLKILREKVCRKGSFISGFLSEVCIGGANPLKGPLL
jgi:hypothetical protein